MRVSKKVAKLAIKKYVGEEPKVDKISTQIEYIKILNWYNQNCSLPELRGFFDTYIKQNYSQVIYSRLKKYSDGDIGPTLCSIARLKSNNVDMSLLYERYDWFGYRIAQLIKDAEVPDVVFHDNEKTSQIITLCEEILDKFLIDYKPFDYVLPKMTPAEAKWVHGYYKGLQIELQLSFEANQPDINYAYRHLTAEQKLAYIDFLDGFVNPSKAKPSVPQEKKPRKPRAKKVKTPAQLVAKVNYLRTYNNLISLDPSKIIGASILWVYNTKTKMISQIYAKGSKGLSVNKSMIIDYDEARSFSKKLSKEEDLKTLQSATKPQLKKYIEALKTKPHPLGSGRISETHIILTVQ